MPIDLESDLKDQVKARYEATVNQLSKQMERDSVESTEAHRLLIPLAPILAAEMEISKFRRELLIRLHKDGSFDHQTIKQLEQELDVDDLRLNGLLKREDE